MLTLLRALALSSFRGAWLTFELSRVNCSFYYKIGACRHGDRCSRKHVKPSYSQTILLPNLYQNPAYDPKNKMNASQLQNHFDAFYEDFWCEMCKYGELEEVVVCDNNNDRKSSPPTAASCILTVVCAQTLLATSTQGSSTKTAHRRPAMTSTRAGTPPAPFIANCRPSPISARRAVA